MNYTILCVENDDIHYEIAHNFLSQDGYRVSRAFDGIEAIKQVQSEDISLVLMDMRMPYMNGFDATRQIREFNQHMPIVALTALAFPEHRELSVEAGCNDYLPKPIRTADLRSLPAEFQ